STMKSALALLLVGCTVVITPAGGQAIRVASASGAMLTNRASFDGRRLLLAGWDEPVASLWDVDSGRRIQLFTGHTDGVRAVALSPDGRQALTGAGGIAEGHPSTDNSVRLWDIDTGRELRRFDGITYPAWRASPVLEVAFGENGRDVMGAGSTRGL